MTSQKFFNNKYGMVLASDSLSTVAFNKTYPGACKIFELKKNPACGLMISGSSEFGGIPFEILVSKFKKSTDLSKIDTVSEIKDKFLDYLAKNTPKVNLNDYIDENISQFKINLEKNIEKMSEKEFWDHMDNTKKSTVFEFLRDYDKYDSIFSDIIPDFISNNDFDFVNELFWMQFSEILSFMESVLFICGFNKNQNFGS